MADSETAGAAEANAEQPEVEPENEESAEPAGADLPVDEDVAAAAAADSPAFVEPRPEDEFRELLASVETPADLAELGSAAREDVERALTAQAERDAGDVADRWEGATARLPDGSVVEVVAVHPPEPAGVLTGEPVTVDVEHGDGRREAVGADELEPAGPASVAVEASPDQAAELLSVLDEGIGAVEDETGGRASFARSLRESVADQHRRLR